MLSRADLVAFVASEDLDASARFYGDVLGFELVESSAFANAYDANGTQLRVTLVENLTPAPYTVLGWRVPDIRAAIAHLAKAGVQFLRFESMEQDQDGIWTAPSGSLIAWFADPDGNMLSLQQAPQR